MKIRQMVVALAGIAALVGCGVGSEDEQPQHTPAPAVPPANVAGEASGQDFTDTQVAPQFGRSGTHDEANDVVHIRQLAPQTPDGQAAKTDGSKQCFCGFCQRTHAPTCL